MIDRSIGPAKISIPEELANAACAAEAPKLDIATRTAMVKQIGEALEQYRGDAGFALPQDAHLINRTT